MSTYYNEIDLYCAEWLYNLIKNNLLPPGDIDIRDIRDVKPSDLAPYTQCHFFAGIGGWPLALRLADFPTDRPVWTGSCPCQPFSAAGKRGGFADERHLWPYWHYLIGQRRPATVLGEQVASKDGLAWYDLVYADLENSNYAVGVADLCAAGVEAPHIRQRLWFVARTERRTAERRRYDLAAAPSRIEKQTQQRKWIWDDARPSEQPCGLADCFGSGLEIECIQPARKECASIERGSATGELVNAESEQMGFSRRSRESRKTVWSDCDWLPCTDGKQRPVEPGTFPLAHGIPARVAKLRALGNAVVPQVAAEFVKAVMDCLP